MGGRGEEVSRNVYEGHVDKTKKGGHTHPEPWCTTTAARSYRQFSGPLFSGYRTGERAPRAGLGAAVNGIGTSHLSDLCYPVSVKTKFYRGATFSPR